jgi:hypothetical protein
MVRIQQAVLILAVLVAPLFVSASTPVPIFFPDDPIERMPPPQPVLKPKPFVHKINYLFDFLTKSAQWKPGPAIPAAGINTVGDPPDSAWYTRRHSFKRMTREELQRGPITGEKAQGPFTIVGGKTEGVTPGFRMEDAKGRLYFVKVDPMSHPEMATAADIIVSRFMYALGYNVPQNSLVYATQGDFKMSKKAELTDETGRKRRMTWDDFKQMTKKIPHYSDGSIRLMASLKIEGDSLGPFYYDETRADDPNDIVLHENRRDLRALDVFYAWLNNTDARNGNTLDVVVNENGVRCIKHYLIDFNSALGSDSDTIKDPRLGHEFMLGTPGKALHSIFTFGVVPKPWETIEYPHLPAAGNFTAEEFHPDDWKSDYPNPAFLSRLPDDEYWATKQLMAFTDDDIRAVVETAQYSNPRVVDYMTKTLIQRRDKIAATFLPKVLPVDDFRIENGELTFDDLAVRYHAAAARRYTVHWFRFDNLKGSRSAIAGAAVSPHLPDPVLHAAPGSYFSAVIESANDKRHPVTVTLRKTDTGYRVVGVSRFDVLAAS